MSHTETGAPQQPANARQTVSVMGRLVPKQLNDELQLTVAQLKSKGVSIGIAAALIVVGIVFVSLLVIALVVAAIAGLATVMPLWLSALLFAALFLVIGGIFAGIGAARAKTLIPETVEVPKQALLRVRHDLGVLQDGTEFNPATLTQPKPKKKDDAKSKDSGSSGHDQHDEAPKPSQSELRTRLVRRREHLANLRDVLGEQTDVKAGLGRAAHKLGYSGPQNPAWTLRQQDRATGEQVMPVLGGVAGALALLGGVAAFAARARNRRERKQIRAMKKARRNH